MIYAFQMNKGMMTKQLRHSIIVAIALMVSYTGMAAILPSTERIYSPHGGTAVQIGQPEAVKFTQASTTAANHTDYTVLNRITFGIDLDYPTFFANDMDVSVDLVVRRWDASMTQLTDISMTLDVAYHPFDNTTMIDYSKQEFGGAYKIEWEIVGITVNGQAKTILPANLYVQGDIFIDRYVEYSTANTAIAFNTAIPLDLDCNGTTDGLKINWNPVPGVEEYQLEWVHVNNYGSTLTSSMNPNDLEYNFKYNSTRISTSETEYDLSLVFDRGWVVYRIRGIGVDYQNINQLIVGTWNLADQGVVGSTTTDKKIEITNAIAHETNFNWQYSATYAEEAKKKEIVSYFDGSLRNRQTVTKINSDQNVIVGETIYDHQGRPAINVLPVPVVDPACQSTDPNKEAVLGYYPKFNQNESNNAYSRNDFDIDQNGCGVQASPMGTQSGASQYYSPNNPDQDMEQAYVPDAQKFPFVQVEYTPDNTGRIRRQGGVGPEYQLGNDHESKYFYGQPNQLELDRLFGSEMGDVTHYKKNVVVDANNQASVSYLDQEGRVIATALAGDAPTNLVALESEANALETLTVNAFGDNDKLNNVSINGNSIEFTTQLLVAYQSNYAFDYSFVVPAITNECLPDYCIDCVYDLKLEIVDECGIHLEPVDATGITVGKFQYLDGEMVFHGICQATTDGSYSDGFTINLPAGSYSVNKILTINEDALNAYIDLYFDETINECVLTYEDFLAEEMANIDTSGCNVTCEDCYANLGSLEDFLAQGLGTQNDYYAMQEDCERICNDEMDRCEVSRSLMEMDMTPGGQYAEYTENQNGFSASSPLSILNDNNQLPDNNASWRNPQRPTAYGIEYNYVEENGDESKIYLTVSGTTPGGYLPQVAVAHYNDVQYDNTTNQFYIAPQHLAHAEDFVDNFIPSWSQSLLVYHPEYCYYEVCLTFDQEVNEGDAYTVDDFDNLLLSSNTFAEAVQNGLIKDNYQSIFNDQNNGYGTTGALPQNNRLEAWQKPDQNDPTSSAYAWDPFIYLESNWQTTDCEGYGQRLYERMLQYEQVNGQWFSMADIAAYFTRCGNTIINTNDLSCFDFGGQYGGSWNTQILDEEWNRFKLMYKSVKDELIQEYMDCYAINECRSYNGCIGNEEYNAVTSGMYDPSQSMNGQPYFDVYQPCNFWNHEMYANKIRRFSSAMDQLEGIDANTVAYNMYLQTGQCPIPFALQNLLNALAVNDELDNSNVDLNSYPEWMSLIIANNNFNNPGTIPVVTHNSTGGSNLTINWIENGGTYATLTIELVGATTTWDDLISINNLYPVNNSSSVFKAEGFFYDINGDIDTAIITGTISNFDLGACSFGLECTSNEFALDLTDLMNVLIGTGNWLSATSVDIDPLASAGNLTGLATSSLIAASGTGSNLHWTYLSPNQFLLADPSATGTDGLMITLTGTSDPNFTWSNLNQVVSIGNIVPIGPNAFKMEATLSGGTTIIIDGTLIRNLNGSVTGIEAGECTNPSTLHCDYIEAKTFETLANMLTEIFVTNNYSGQSIDLFALTSMNSSVSDYLIETISGVPQNVTHTTSTEVGGVLTIEAGDCDIVLRLPPAFNTYSFSDITNIGLVSVTGSPDGFGNYQNFIFNADLSTGASTVQIQIEGTSCLNLRPCEDCLENVIVSTVPSEGTARSLMESYILLEEESMERYYDYTNAVDALNAREGWTSSDPEFVSKISYSYFFDQGYQYPKAAYVKYIDYFIVGLDNPDYLSDYGKYVVDYGFATNVKMEYERYVNAVSRYNALAAYMGQPSMTAISLTEFEDGHYAALNADYISYLETQPTYNSVAYPINIQVASTTFNVDEKQLYNDYVAAYRNFMNSQQIDTTCQGFDKIPMYAIEDFQASNLFCSEAGVTALKGYIESFNSGGCPSDLPQFRDCTGGSATDETQTCQRSFQMYNDALNSYNQSEWATTNSYTLESPFTSFFRFKESKYRPCVNDYIAYLDVYTKSVNPNDPSTPPLNLIQFAPCGDPVATMAAVESDPCMDAYDNYLNCLKNFRELAGSNYPTVVLPMLDYDGFLQLESCDCVDQYCATLTGILDGTIIIDEQQGEVYIVPACDTRVPCTPEPMSGQPFISPTVELEDDCIAMAINQAIFSAQNNYNEYVEQVTNDLISQYYDHCINQVDEDMTYMYKDKLYHFMLYYYDQAGNLIKTIPPAGVAKLPISASTDALAQQIVSDRTNATRTVFTSHTLPTRYEYNSLNQLVTQSSPDMDAMDIFNLKLTNGLHPNLITQKIQMIDGSTGYLTGEVDGRGYLYKTTDGGQIWHQINNLVAADLNAVEMLDANVGIAVGDNGTVIRTLDGGLTWDMLDTWSVAGMIKNLNDVSFVPNGLTFEGVLVGDNLCVAKIDDVNAAQPTFTIVNAGLTGNVATTNVTAITNDGTNYYITVNDLASEVAYVAQMPLGGTSWTIENDFTTNGWNSMDFFSTSAAYAAGNDGRLYRNDDVLNTATPATWKLVPSSISKDFSEIRFFDQNQGVALTSDGMLYRTLDGGSSWNTISTATFNTLYESEDHALILAAGDNGAMEIVVPTTDPFAPNILVAHPSSPNFTACWIDRETTTASSNVFIMVADANGTVWTTDDALAAQPTWSNTATGTVISELSGRRFGTNIVRGVAISSAGTLYGIDKGGLNTITLTSLSAYASAAALDVVDDRVYTYNHTTNELAYTLLNSSPTNNYNVVDPVSNTTLLNTLIASNKTVVGGGSAGDVALMEVATSGTSMTTTEMDTKTAPKTLNAVSYNSTTSQLVIGGADAVLYERNAGIWERVNTAQSDEILDIAEHGSDFHAVGRNGLFLSGALNSGSNTYAATPQSLTNSQTIASTLSATDIYAVSAKGTRVYAVGENGTVLYTPNNSLLNYGIVQSGTEDLGAVSFLTINNKAMVVGGHAQVQQHAGANYIVRKDVFVPAGIDLHFADVNTGTLLADNFTVRTTSNAGDTWSVVVPTTSVAPAGPYKAVWTRNSIESYVLGTGAQFEVTNGTANNLNLTGVTSVAAVNGTANELYIANGPSIVRLDMSNNTVNSTTNAISAINDLQVFNNGSYAVVGDNGLFQYFDAANTSVFSGGPAGVNINAVSFTDNTNGVVVGDNGAYYKTTGQSINTNGYLTGTGWQQQVVLGASIDPLGIATADIYTVDHASSVDILFGGTNLSSTPSYVRRAFDPNARYSSRFFYDKLGRLVVSQNSRQYSEAAGPKYSYTKYDFLGRVVEVGEKTENPSNDLQFKDIFGTYVSSYFNPAVIDDNNLNDWINGSGERREVTKSYYDEQVITGIPGFNPDISTQRKRIVHVSYEEVFDGDDQTYDHATHYDYDIHGNVKTLIQDNQKMANTFPTLASQRYKKMDYTYDLVSGNVHRMSVQDGAKDQWHHAYRYDSDNRITEAYTNKQTPLLANNVLPQALENELLLNADWENDAKYFYYNHGPLARTEIGEHQLQGMDYVYNIQGWLKGVNATTLEDTYDPGHDGMNGSINDPFAKDAMSFSLHYFKDDYLPISTTASFPYANVENSDLASNSNDLYNGNIKVMQTTITDPTTGTVLPQANAYQYDQLNRLLKSKSFVNLSGQQWGNAGTYDNRYFNAFTYDAMGNILTQERHLEDGTQIEDMTYRYQYDGNGLLLRNRLYHINDAISSTVDNTDIDDQGTFETNPLLINGDNNYVYDAEGRLIKDKQENIDNIEWRVDGKIKRIKRTSGSDTKIVSFDYDAMGNRIAKHVEDNLTGLPEKSTYYVLDAMGNTLNTYEHVVDNQTTTYNLQERQIYGSSRLGIYDETVDMFTALPVSGTPYSHEQAHKYYEMSNHLGNVLTVITDKKEPLSSNGTDVDGYTVFIVNSTDYTGFGVEMDGRKFETDFYRYSFQGQEKDDEIKGEGNSLNYRFRMHDSRVGRFFAIDPLSPKYPFYTPYSFSGNQLIAFIELEGLEQFEAGKLYTKEAIDQILEHGMEKVKKAKLLYESAETEAEKERLKKLLDKEKESYKELILGAYKHRNDQKTIDFTHDAAVIIETMMISLEVVDWTLTILTIGTSKAVTLPAKQGAKLAAKEILKELVEYELIEITGIPTPRNFTKMWKKATVRKEAAQTKTLVRDLEGSASEHFLEIISTNKGKLTKTGDKFIYKTDEFTYTLYKSSSSGDWSIQYGKKKIRFTEE